MDMLKILGTIDKDIIDEKNKDKVYDIMGTLAGDVILVDENGNEIMSEAEIIARKQLEEIGEIGIIKKWID
ncbi:MAG: hypothetical protein GXZ11_02230 [Tissierellia bacterium]|nr:hypothetical protein [Tissierellia bacterium]